MSDQFRAVVIGCGKIAGGYNRGPNDAKILTHALAYARHPSFSLAACVEPEATTRVAFQTKWCVPNGYACLEEALNAEHFDIASVCSPTATHLLVLEQLADSNVSMVFAEKPLGGDGPGAKKIAARFSTNEVPVAVNFTRRFDPIMRAFKFEIAAGQYGELRGVCGWYSRGVVNNGCHMLDLVTFLVGHLPRTKSIAGAIDDGVFDDPSVSATLDLNGVPFQLIACDGRDFARFEIEFTFSNAIVSLEDSGQFIRRRSIIESEFTETKVAERGTWTPTGYGEAMLRALDELQVWPSTRKLSSDINSAIGAIMLAEEIQSAAKASKPGINQVKRMHPV